MGKVRRDDSAPPRGPSLRIFRLKANDHRTVSIFGTHIHGFWTHWSGSASEPCTEPKTECIGCQREWPLRWKAYIHCHVQELQEEGFLEMTPVVKDQLLLEVGGEKELRGSRITIQRGKGDKARMQVRLISRWQSLTSAAMPPELDPEDTLVRLWEFGKIRRKGNYTNGQPKREENP